MAANDKKTEEKPEGIIVGTTNRKSGVMSVVEIETLDALSEGLINGIVDREYSFVGTKGNIGWTSYTEKIFPDPPNAVGFGWLRSVYWNQVPIVSSNNKYNFQRVDMTRTEGYPNGSILGPVTDNFLTVTRPINERLRASVVDKNNVATEASKDYIKYYRILNTNCVGFILNVKTPRLSQTALKDGDVYEAEVIYNIYYRALFNNAASDEVQNYSPGFGEVIYGKISNPYIRSTRVLFNANDRAEEYKRIINRNDFYGWEIKVVRVTPDSSTLYLQNQTIIDSLTEIYADSFLYPNAAMVRSRFSAEFFSGIPERAYDVRLLKVKVPSNYDPIKRTYSRMNPEYEWDGTFSETKKWTDNPAWCFYDLVTNKRYGLGKYIPEVSIDKWTLYKIAQYCDTLVEDGRGGLEPRFTCNLILFTREEAYKILNDMVSIFNAMTYYFNGSIYVSQDSPKSPRLFFNNASVENGSFVYSATPKRVRHSVAIVRYNDPNNFYQPAVEYVEDIQAIRRYGIKEVEVAAFGCTSRGQAIRQGKWILASENFQTESCSFAAGNSASLLKPGDIVGIYDGNRKNNLYAGRVSNYVFDGTNHLFILDRVVSLDSTKSYYLHVSSSTYVHNPTEVSNLNSNDIDDISKSYVQKLLFAGSNTSVNTTLGKTYITVTTAPDTANYQIVEGSVWAIEKNETLTSADYETSFDADYDLFQVVKITEKEVGKYVIDTIQYNQDKFDYIDQNVSFDRTSQAITVTPSAPKSVNSLVITTSRNVKKMALSFVPPDNLSGLSTYRIYSTTGDFTGTTPDDNQLVSVLPVGVQSSYYYPTVNGDHKFRIYGYNDEGKTFSNDYISFTNQITDIYPIENVIISSLGVDGYTGTITTGSSTKDLIPWTETSPTFSWQAGLEDGGIGPGEIYYRVSFRQSSSGNIPSNVIYYQETGWTAQTLTFNFDVNRELVGGPYRDYDVVVEAVDGQGNTSAGNRITGLLQENGWYYNSNGYDIIHVYNPRPTGINITGAGNYAFIDYNGGVNFLFNTGIVSGSVVGGYIFASTGSFTSGEALSGRSWITQREFSYNSKERFAYAPACFNPYVQFKTGYATIAFYDSYDAEIKEYANILSGLQIPAPIAIYTTGIIQDAEVKGRIMFPNSENYGKYYSFFNYPSGTGAHKLLASDESGDNIIIASKK